MKTNEIIKAAKKLPQTEQANIIKALLIGINNNRRCGGCTPTTDKTIAHHVLYTQLNDYPWRKLGE